MTELHINDPLAMRDLSAFTSLAHRADSDGAMRLQVASDVLAATVAPLFPHGLGDSTPLVLAMRMLRLDDHELDGFDEAVPLSNLLDRFARDENGTTLPVPPNSVLVSWTGIAPPRGGAIPVHDTSTEFGGTGRVVPFSTRAKRSRRFDSGTASSKSSRS